MSLTPAAEAALTAHSWPGNVRELENVIQRALIMATGKHIGAETLHIVSRPNVETQPSGHRSQEILSDAGLTEPLKKADNMKDLEREHILSTLAEVGGSRKKAIERLGISERTLRYKLQQYRDEGHFQD